MNAPDANLPFPDDDLDAGLRAAFAYTESITAHSVIATLEDTVGHAPVALRETPDEPAPMVRPVTRRTTNAVGSRYQVLGEIARGGVGVVLKGRDVDLGRDVAMKVLRDDRLDSPDMVRRFVEEAQIAGQLQHPGILPVYDLGLRADRTPYFTMKLVKGETLAELLGRRRVVDEDRTRFLGIFEQVAQTLAYAHAKGVIHRDLKPSNILVGAFGEVQVVDWGLAKVLAHGGLADERQESPKPDESVVETVRSQDDSSASLVGSVMGTPAYMSPAQARGDVDQLDERSDVFSLGAILCEILTGDPPYRGDRSALLEQARCGDISAVRPRLLESDAEPDLVDLTMRCLDADPAERPANARAVVESVTAHLESLRRRAHESEIAAARAETKASEEMRRRKLAIGVGIVLLLVGSVVSVGAFYYESAAAERRAAATDRIASALENASGLLGRAIEAPVGVTEPWFEAKTAIENLAAMVDHPDVETETRRRARALIERYERADADRALTVAMENAVIMGATHLDPESWTWMEGELRAAFLAYGIDILTQDNESIAASIAQSELSGALADGFELWIATGFHLASMGEPVHPLDWLQTKLAVLATADSDPFATEVRRLLYSPNPTRAEIEELLDGIDLSEVRPRSVAWLGGVCVRAGSTDLMDDIYRRTLLEHPDDFMLNFDYAYSLQALGRWQEVIRYAMRCIAIRPAASGVWRMLGNAHVQVGEHDHALAALGHSVELQPNHIATYVDLARAQTAADQIDAAIRTCEFARERKPDHRGVNELLEELRNTPSNPTEKD